MSVNATKRGIAGGVSAAIAMLGLATTPRGSAAGANDALHRDVLKIDGVVVSIERYRLDANAADAANARADAWRREEPAAAVVRSTAGRWRVLGQRRGATYRSAQFEPVDGGTIVTVATREWNPRPERAVLPFALPPALEVLRTVETVDERPAVLQVVARASMSPNALRERLALAADRDGWRLEAAPVATARGNVVTWRRGADEVVAVIDGTARTATLLLQVVRRTEGRPR